MCNCCRASKQHSLYSSIHITPGCLDAKETLFIVSSYQNDVDYTTQVLILALT